MSPAFGRALEFTLSPEIEGGLSDVKGDRGGRTNHGVTQVKYDAWRGAKGLAKQPVDYVTEAEEREFYFEEYWEPCNCDALPEPLCFAVFDMAVNSGPMNAKLTLQRCLGGLRPDGVLGPRTLERAREVPDALLRFLVHRGAFIQEEISVRPLQVQFLEGWIKRLLLQMWTWRHP